VEGNSESQPEFTHHPPLPVSELEVAAIDAAILQMAKLGRRRGVTCTSLRQVRDDEDLCKRTDEMISETFTSLKGAVPDDAAEKFFERLSRIVDGWADRDEQMTLGIVFVRLMDTMRYFIAYKQKFRGVARKSSISKGDALAELKVRGLTRR
jgi:hypothetical protein